MNKSVFQDALSYCRLRLLPFNELGYEETLEYGLRRSRLHNSMARRLDIDRELVELAFARAERKFGFKVKDGILIDGSNKSSFSFTDAYDAFCDELEKLAELPDAERHPNVLSHDELDKIVAECKSLPVMANLLAFTQTEGETKCS